MKRIFSSIILMMFVVFLVGSCSTLSIIKPRFPGPVKTEAGILFKYYAPSAHRVTLAGEFNNWESGYSEKAINLVKDSEGVWSVTVPIAPGRYKYKFVVDGTKWEADPNGESANDSDGNSQVVVD
jgi:1,4-alpha-glucan branching enzyme